MLVAISICECDQQPARPCVEPVSVSMFLCPISIYSDSQLYFYVSEDVWRILFPMKCVKCVLVNPLKFRPISLYFEFHRSFFFPAFLQI